MAKAIINKTYEQWATVIKVLNSVKEEKTKFSYAKKRVLDRLIPLITAANKKHTQGVEDASIEFASVDEKENLVMDGDNYKYTKEKAKERLIKLRNLDSELMSTLIGIEDYIIDSVPESVNEYQLEILTGVIFKDNEITDTNTSV